MTESEKKQHEELAIEVKSKADEATNIIEAVLAKTKANDTNEGLSFLELKNLLMIDYLSNLTYLMLKKSFGKSIANDESTERLVENRTVLEKMRPLEKKLKYQIDKYVKVADSGSIAENDPLHFKPNLDALDQDEDEEEDDLSDDGESGNNKDSVKKYVAPRHVPTYYDQEENPEAAEKEKADKLKKRVLSRGLIDDLKSQHLDTPMEVYDMETVKQSRQAARERERTRYEEENFMRLPETKQDRKAKRRSQMGLTMGRLGDELTHDFGKSRFDDGPGGMKRKRSGSFKKGSAKKKFSRRK